MPSSARRSKLLPAMLISLGVAAAAGIGAVLVPGRDVVGEVVLMAILTAVGCGLVMVAARFLDKREHRLAAEAAIAVIAVGYLLGLLLCWDEATSFLGMRGGDCVAQATFFLFAAGIPMIIMCRLMRTASARIAGTSGLALLSVAAGVMLIGAFASEASDRNSENIALYGFWIELFSLPLVACLVGLETDTRRRPLFRLVGIASAFFGLWSLLYTLIVDKEFNPSSTFVIATVVCVFVGHLNMAIRATLSPGMAWIRWLTVLAVAVTGVLIVVTVQIMQAHNYTDADPFERLIAAAGICAGCGTVAIMIIAWMNRKTVEREMIAPADLHDIQLQCPACKAKQTLPLGDSACSECGLRFLIKVDEPHCETCGYLLYRLKSDRCPECGTPVTTAQIPNDQTRMTNEIPMPNVQ